MEYVMPISHNTAADAGLSGGKGANSHVLERLHREHACFLFPATSVITTGAFDSLVLADPSVQRAVRRLHDLSHFAEGDAGCQTIAEDIQAAIRAAALPQDLLRQLSHELSDKGGDLAVRSSAICEDGHRHAAAGLGYSTLHQTSVADVAASVKEVWASLYSPSFIAYRAAIGYPELQARMAVLLQTFINARAAGAVNSFDQGTGRPGYCITAQPGLGEGVVKAKGAVDHWFVGFLCEEIDILERSIPVKQRRFVASRGGGISEESICQAAPSLDDAMILRVARAAKIVHAEYARRSITSHVDLEFAVDSADRLFLVQVRPKWLQARTGADGELAVKTTTVDLIRVAAHVESVVLSETSLLAVDGAVTARLAVVRGNRAARDLLGRVIVAHHTNNEFNAMFASFAAVITSDGGQTSHAAQHAYEKRIPCVVGSAGAVEALAPYDGQLVTFDAGRRTVFLGEVPIVSLERNLGVWLTDASLRFDTCNGGV